MTKSQLIGAEDAARILGITKKGVLARLHNGLLEPLAQVGKRGTYVFDRAEIESLACKEAAK